MSPIETLIERLSLHAKEALIRGAIWAFIGLLYGTLFVSFAVFSRYWTLAIDPYFVGGIMAGTIGAVIYSSMRLAVLMATLLYPAGIIYFASMEGAVTLKELFLIMIPLGAVIGALYGITSKGSRIRRADAKTLAGFTSGVLATTGYLILTRFIDPIDIMWVVGVMAPLTGVFYVTMVPAFIKRYQNLLPPAGDGALVGACVAVFISISSFVMAGSVDTQMVGVLIPEVEHILSQIPSAAIGGIIGAGSVGILSGLMLTDWQDL